MTMDNLQRESSNGEPEPKESTEVAKDVTSQLLTIENMLLKNDEEFNNYTMTIVMKAEAFRRCERRLSGYLSETRKALPYLRQVEMVVAVIRLHVLEMMEQTSAQSAEIEETCDSIMEVVNGLKNRIVIMETRITSIRKKINAEKTKSFMAARKIKERRRQIIDECDKLLAVIMNDV